MDALAAADWRVLRGRHEPLLYALPAAALSAVAVVGLQIEPLLPLLTLCGAAVAALALARPLAAVLVGIASAPLALVALPLEGETAVSPPEAIFVVVAVAWALRRLTRGAAPWTPSPLGKPLFGLLLAVVAGVAVAIEPGPVLRTLVMWTAFLLVFQLVVTEADVAWVRRALLILGLSGAVVGLIALVGTSGEEQKLVGLGSEATGRASTSFGHPNLLAAFLGLSLPAALSLALAGPTATRPLMLAAFGLVLAGLGLTLSRAGLLAAAGGLLVLLAWRPFRRAAAAGLAVLVVVLVLTGGSVAGPPMVDVVAQRLESIQYPAAGADPRLRLWNTVPEIVADHPLFGVGAANFEYAGPRYGLIDPLTDSPFDHAHNFALTIAAELGTIGFALLLWLVFALGVTMVRACARSCDHERALAFAVTAAIASFAVHSMLHFPLRSNVIAATFMILCACAVALSRSRPTGSRAPRLEPAARTAGAPA